MCLHWLAVTQAGAFWRYLETFPRKVAWWFGFITVCFSYSCCWHWLTHTSQSQVKMLAIMQNKKIPRLWKCRNNIRNDNQSVFDICLVFIWDQIIRSNYAVFGSLEGVYPTVVHNSIRTVWCCWCETLANSLKCWPGEIVNTISCDAWKCHLHDQNI